MTKRCSKCGRTKPLSAYYADRRSSDGLQSQCKRCMNDKSAEHNRRHPEQARQRVKESRQRADYKIAQAARQRLWRKQHPEKTRAHRAVARAIANGRLKRPAECGRCGAGCKPVAHHDDYDKPLDVQWLCPACHSAVDARRPRITT